MWTQGNRLGRLVVSIFKPANLAVSKCVSLQENFLDTSTIVLISINFYYNKC